MLATSTWHRSTTAATPAARSACCSKRWASRSKPAITRWPHGQHEIDFKYDDALTTADKIMTFKLTVKTTAQRNGLHATFMPKPLFGVNGSGMHTNMSLFKNGKNIFYDEKRQAPAFQGSLQLSSPASC
jgi:hypothetical protein